jgi:hypothetical protein
VVEAKKSESFQNQLYFILVHSIGKGLLQIIRQTPKLVLCELVVIAADKAWAGMAEKPHRVKSPMMVLASLPRKYHHQKSYYSSDTFATEKH